MKVPAFSSKTFNPKAVLWLILLGAFALHLWVSMDPYLHEWDERYHALVAKNLMPHPLKPTLYDNPVLLIPGDPSMP